MDEKVKTSTNCRPVHAYMRAHTLKARALCNLSSASHGAQINKFTVRKGGGVNLMFGLTRGRGLREGMAHQSAFDRPKLAYAGLKLASVGPESATVRP